MRWSDSLVRKDLERHVCFREPQAPVHLPLRPPVLKADANENPYGCAPQVRTALGGVMASLYPDPTYGAVREAIADYCGADPAGVVVGNGADECIDLLLRACLEPGEEVINLPPTFGMYEFFVRLNRGEVVEVPRDERFQVPVDRVLEAITPRTKSIFLCVPNNPTGNSLPQESLVRLLESRRLVVVDETYYEFCGQTALPLLREHENLVIVRSLSKWAGLAGLRVGYLACAPGLAAVLNRIRPPYNVNAAAEAAAVASLRCPAAALDSVKKIVRERERLRSLLSSFDFLEPLPSGGNFVLCFVKDGDVDDLRRFLDGRGIRLRWFGDGRLRRAVRVSIGRPEDTDRLVAALEAWREGR